MKSSARYALSTAATFFALCATVVACGPGGGYRSGPTYPSYPSYPTPYSNVTSAPIVSPPAAVTSVPQAHISVVSTTDEAPVGHLQIASPVAEDKTAEASVRDPSTEATPSSAANTEEPVAKTDLNKSLDSLNATKNDTSKIDDAIKGLVGTWRAVSRQGDGELSTVELQLDDHGWAKLTVPGVDGKPSTTTRKVEFDNSELKLTGADTDVLLGKLVDFNSRQMVLERSGGQVTFVRP